MRVNVLWRLLLACLMLTMAACSTISGWFSSDDYEAPPSPLVTFKPEFEPKVVWSVDTGKGANNAYTDLGAWLQDDKLFTVDYEGDVSSYQADNGKKIWETELDVSVEAGAGGGDGLIMIGTRDGQVIALDEKTGKKLWKQSLTSEVLAPPKVAKGIVVVRSADGRLSGLSAKDGSTVWSYQRAVPLLTLRGVGAPVIDGDKVFAGYDSGKMVALSLADGKLVWEKSVAIPRGRTEMERLVDIDADPVVKNGVVYAVSYQGKLAALSEDTGNILWSHDMSSRTGLAVAPGAAIYVSDDSDYVWAIQDGSGDSLWRQTRLLRRKISAPAIAGKYVVVGDFEGYLHWIARSDGRFVARQQISDSPIVSQPIVYKGLIYVTSNDGTLTAVQVPAK